MSATWNPVYGHYHYHFHRVGEKCVVNKPVRADSNHEGIRK